MPEPTTESATGRIRNPLFTRLEAERRALAAAHEAEQRRQIVGAAGIDPAKLSDQAQRTLNWLAGWGDPTTAGIVELLQATRATEREKVAVSKAVARTDAAPSRKAEHRGLSR